MTEVSYSARHIDWLTVKEVRGDEIHSTTGWVCCAAPNAAKALRPGMTYGVETHRTPFGRISGVVIGGRWYDRKSDEDLERQYQELIDDSARRDRERLDKMRGEWIGREENLPPWLKDRIHVFHERGGEKFKLEGWGYELVVCELAALYAESGGEDNDEVRAYGDRHGTSGNQHDCAKALAKAHASGRTLAGTVAALSPITGSAFYEPTS